MRVPEILMVIFFINSATSNRLILKSNRTLNSGRFQRSHSNSDKIYGGSYVDDMRKYPYMVSIKLYSSHQCGGGLLNLIFVVTACHCLAYVDEEHPGSRAVPVPAWKIKSYRFVAGTNNIEHYESHVQFRQAKSFYFHPLCQFRTSLIYDHAVAKMREPFIETPYVKPLKMYSWDRDEFRRYFQEMFSFDGNPECFVAGWGDTRRGMQASTIVSPRLKALQMYVLTNKHCMETWLKLAPEQFRNFNFWDYGEICAVSENIDESDCAGDSGSPFVCDGHLVATVSYGEEECANSDQAPSVYATVANLVAWLRANFKHDIDMTKSDLKPITREKPSTKRSGQEPKKKPRKEPSTSCQQRLCQNGLPILSFLMTLAG